MPITTDSGHHNKIQSTKFQQSETIPQEAEVYWYFKTSSFIFTLQAVWKKSICKDLINTFKEIITQFWHSILKSMPIK